MDENVSAEPLQGQELLKDPLKNEFLAFREMLPQLLQRYKGEYVAIYEGKLLGHHPDDRELARRTFKKVGDVPFLLIKVSETLPIDDFPSPEEF